MLTLPGNWGNILSANWLIPEEEQTWMLTYQRDGFCFFEKDIPASETWQKTYLVLKMIYMYFKEVRKQTLCEKGGERSLFPHFQQGELSLLF